MSSENNGIPLSASRSVTNLQGKLKRSFLIAYPHCVVPGYNVNNNASLQNYDEQRVMELFRQFPYSCDLPKPLLPPAKLPQCVLKNEDPALQLLTRKTKFNEDMNRLNHYYKKHEKDLKIYSKMKVEWKKQGKNIATTTLPKYVAELAETIESDPCPQFEGEYNWLYTGGTLNNILVSNKNVLIFPYAKELVATELLERSKSFWKPKFENAQKCNLQSVVYETRSVNRNNICRVLTRHKNSCNIYKLSMLQDELKMDNIQTQFSELPYVSADLNPVDPNKYCLTNTNRSVEFWDVNRKMRLNSVMIPQSENSVDNWLSVRYNLADSNLLTYVDRCCLHHIDLRSSSHKPCLTLCPKNNLEICESISLNLASKYNSWYQYLGTSHSFMLCDMRFKNSCVTQKWNMQFKSPALFAEIIHRSDEEIIVLASQLSREHCVIINTWANETTMHSYSLPYVPPSISETLEVCQSEGKCLDPSLRSRFELCNIGITLATNNNDDISYFIQNSIGDIFYQGITHKGIEDISEMNVASISALNTWEKALLKQSKTIKPLLLSEEMNMQHVLNGIKDESLHLEYKEPEPKDIEPRWFQTTEKLTSYVDILAPELLSVWDVKPEPVPVMLSTQQKVLSWLERKSPELDSTQLQNESSILNESNEIFNQELMSVSQITRPEQDCPLNKSYDIIETTKLDIPELVTKEKRTAKKRKFIAGF